MQWQLYKWTLSLILPRNIWNYGNYTYGHYLKWFRKIFEIIILHHSFLIYVLASSSLFDTVRLFIKYIETNVTNAPTICIGLNVSSNRRYLRSKLGLLHGCHWNNKQRMWCWLINDCDIINLVNFCLFTYPNNAANIGVRKVNELSFVRLPENISNGYFSLSISYGLIVK